MQLGVFFGMFSQWRSLEIIPNRHQNLFFVPVKLGGTNIHQPAISGQLPRGFDPCLKPPSKNLELHDYMTVAKSSKHVNTIQGTCRTGRGPVAPPAEPRFFVRGL